MLPPLRAIALQNEAARERGPLRVSAVASSHLELAPAAPRLHNLDALLQVQMVPWSCGCSPWAGAAVPWRMLPGTPTSAGQHALLTQTRKLSCTWQEHAYGREGGEGDAAAMDTDGGTGAAHSGRCMRRQLLARVQVWMLAPKPS